MYMYIYVRTRKQIDNNLPFSVHLYIHGRRQNVVRSKKWPTSSRDEWVTDVLTTL